MLLSIIIPVYNCANYLQAALESVCKQTYKNLEILIVNDGSTDNSRQIIDAYIKKDKRIQAFHLTNNGVSISRNYGLKQATGEYIMFLDPDDTYEKDYCEHMLHLIASTNAKIAMSNYSLVRNNRKYTNDLHMNNDANTGILSQHEALKLTISDNGFKGFVWNRIYSKELLENILFDEQLTYLEDMVFNINLFIKVPFIAFSKIPKYNYLQRTDSVSNNLNKSYFQALNEIKILIPSDLKGIIDATSYYALLTNFSQKENKDKHNYINDEIQVLRKKPYIGTVKLVNPMKNLFFHIGLLSPRLGSFLINSLNSLMSSRIYAYLKKEGRQY